MSEETTEVCINTPEMAEFLAKAYGMPATARALIIMKADSLELRNYLMIQACFQVFTISKTIKEVIPDKLEDASYELRNEFLATAVVKMLGRDPKGGA